MFDTQAKLLLASSYLYTNQYVEPRDVAYAAALYEDTLKVGEPSAFFHLGKLLVEAPDGVTKDEVRGARLLQKFVDAASAREIRDARDEIGTREKRDLLSAFIDGGGEARYILGTLYEQGRGVSPDRQKAVSLFQDALTAGVSSSLEDEVFTALGRNDADPLGLEAPDEAEAPEEAQP